MHTRPVLGLSVMAAAAFLAACESKQRESQTATPPVVPPAATQPAPAAPPAPARLTHSYAQPADYDTPAAQTTELPSGLRIDDLKIGDGAVCLPRAVATFHYRARPVGGAEFMATAEKPEPAAPESQAISRMMLGMKEGLVGMRVGGRRRLTIPADMAFGFLGAKNPAGEYVVQPDTPVVFIVDLVELKQGFAAPQPAAAPQ